MRVPRALMRELELRSASVRGRIGEGWGDGGVGVGGIPLKSQLGGLLQLPVLWLTSKASPDVPLSTKNSGDTSYLEELSASGV